jgi:hypothetical protein
VLDAGFPDRDWWPLTFAGIAMVLLALRGRRAGAAFLFSWGRVAESQSESPLAPLAAWLGIAGLGFAMVWLVALLIELGFAAEVRSVQRWALAGIAVALVFAIPAWPTPTHGTVRIAAVQGNGPAGYFDRAPVGAVFDTRSRRLRGSRPTNGSMWSSGPRAPRCPTRPGTRMRPPSSTRSAVVTAPRSSSAPSRSATASTSPRR